MQAPFFSIIIPVYKVRSDYLDTCLKSILNQSFNDIEIIIIDDGSPDNCGLICDNYAEKDKRIKVLHQDNQGVSAARNAGIEMAIGEWIMFVDPDDWVKDNSYEKLSEYLMDNDIDILMFRHEKVSNSKRSTLKFNLKPNIVYDTSDPVIKEELYRLGMRPKDVGFYGFQYCWDKVYRRKFIVENSIEFPISIHKSEDKVFILRCLEKLHRLMIVNETIYCYRVNTDGACYRYKDNADSDRAKLASLLIDMSHCMDKEIGELKEYPNGEYNVIYNDCINFLFFIITDILFLKFFHPDNPDQTNERFRKARRFIQSEPFRTVIKQVRYDELSNARKIKKILLSIGAIRTFYVIFRLKY